MENSKKSLKKRSRLVNRAEIVASSSTHILLNQLNRFLSAHLKPNANVLLALSGGLDSTVLLHLLASARLTILFNLRAMHVHHGLSKNADTWAEFCISQCALFKVPLEVIHVNVDNATKLGVEAVARKLRYAALASDKSADFIVTAHHQNDQAETLLLQLLRGAGVKGLASMAYVDLPRRLLRPLLGVPRPQLQDYAHLHGIQWCEDESNENTDFERNFVRHEVIPVIETRYSAAQTVLARVASHLSEANDLLVSLAKIDADKVVKEGALCLQALKDLDAQTSLAQPRAKNLLRWWFAKNQLSMPSTEQLSEIIEQLFNAKVDANINISLQHLTLKRYQHRAYLIQPHAPKAFDLVWNGEATLSLPNGGRLLFNQTTGAGLKLALGMNKLRVTNRAGGERFKPNALRPTRTLKHLLQEANIPPWQRDHTPLVYWQDTLALIPNIGIAHELQATEDELGLVIAWQAHD